VDTPRPSPRTNRTRRVLNQVPGAADGAPGVANYQLTFSPDWICNVEGELTLRNQTVGDTYVYQLKGVGEDPVAEDHVSIACKARWRSSAKISVRNLLGNEECRYRVEADLLGLSGARELVPLPPPPLLSY
jgi:hypothetical protein